jgi:hypothetical protein
VCWGADHILAVFGQSPTDLFAREVGDLPIYPRDIGSPTLIQLTIAVPRRDTGCI